MLHKKSTQAINTFYLNDDPTVILESEEVAASFNAELKAQVQQRLAMIAQSRKEKSDDSWQTRTAENPFSYDYVLERLENSIMAAEAKNDSAEALRLGILLKKLQNQELAPVQIVRLAWLRS